MVFRPLLIVAKNSPGENILLSLLLETTKISQNFEAQIMAGAQKK